MTTCARQRYIFSISVYVTNYARSDTYAKLCMQLHYLCDFTTMAEYQNTLLFNDVKCRKIHVSLNDWHFSRVNPSSCNISNPHLRWSTSE